MIDMSKQYTYNGKPVRIYADGSDTYGKQIHGAILDRTEWTLCTFNESDLVEVWQPKEGEIVMVWDNRDDLPSIRRYRSSYKSIWDNYAPFTGTLPEAFKGLV